MATVRLPLEILHHIITFIESIVTLKALSLVSKSMNAIVSKKLWNSVCLNHAANVVHIQHLPIKELDLEYSECEDEHLTIVSRMQELTRLNLSGNEKLTSQGLCQVVSNLSHLEHLNLSDCGVDESVIRHVSKITSLQELAVSGCHRFTDKYRMLLISKHRT